MDVNLGYHHHHYYHDDNNDHNNDLFGERGLVGVNNNGGSYYNRDFYSSFYRTLSWVPKLPAALSILASAYILYDILHNSTKRQKMTNQIMVGLSVADMGYSLAHLVGTWAVVEGQVWGSRGTIRTCEAQGFIHLGFFHTASFYNAMLALTFVLMVRFGCQEETFFRRYKRNYAMLLLPPILGTVVAVPNLSNNNFNFTGQWLCSGGPWPVGCDAETTVPCTRGDPMTDMFANTECFVMCFWLAVACASIIIVSMLVLYCTVLLNERAMDKYQFRAEGRSSSTLSLDQQQQQQQRRSIMRMRRHSNDVAYQGILYVWAYIINSVCFILLNVPKKRFSHEIDLIIAVLSPLQGFFNVLVYLRPRYLHHRRKHSRNSSSSLLCDTMRRICNPWRLKTKGKNSCGCNSESRHDQEPMDDTENRSNTIENEEEEDIADCEPSMLFLLDASESVGTGNNHHENIEKFANEDSSSVEHSSRTNVKVDVLQEITTIENSNKEESTS